MSLHFLGLCLRDRESLFSRDIGQTHIKYTLMIQEMYAMFFYGNRSSNDHALYLKHRSMDNFEMNNAKMSHEDAN
jgi:hypothetical protein